SDDGGRLAAEGARGAATDAVAAGAVGLAVVREECAGDVGAVEEGEREIGGEGADAADHGADDAGLGAVGTAAFGQVLENATITRGAVGGDREGGTVPAHRRGVHDGHTGLSARVGGEKFRREVVAPLDNEIERPY